MLGIIRRIWGRERRMMNGEATLVSVVDITTMHCSVEHRPRSIKNTGGVRTASQSAGSHWVPDRRESTPHPLSDTIPSIDHPPRTLGCQDAYLGIITTTTSSPSFTQLDETTKYENRRPFVPGSDRVRIIFTSIQTRCVEALLYMPQVTVYSNSCHIIPLLGIRIDIIRK
jgi:hypothetical protein